MFFTPNGQISIKIHNNRAKLLQQDVICILKTEIFVNRPILLLLISTAVDDAAQTAAAEWLQIEII